MEPFQSRIGSNSFGAKVVHCFWRVDPSFVNSFVWF